LHEQARYITILNRSSEKTQMTIRMYIINPKLSPKIMTRDLTGFSDPVSRPIQLTLETMQSKSKSLSVKKKNDKQA